MRRIVLGVVAVAACWAAPARAETLPLFEGVPATYTPGTAFTFTVRIPQLADVTGFSVDLIFATDVQNPPLFVTAAPADVGPGGRYVFPSNATFQSGITPVADSNAVLFTLSDSTAPGVFVEPGVNDTLAVITVQPGAGLTGPITISLGNDTVFSANQEGTNYDSPPQVVIAQADGPGPSPVPAPTGAFLLGLGGFLLGARNRLARSGAAAR